LAILYGQVNTAGRPAGLSNGKHRQEAQNQIQVSQEKAAELLMVAGMSNWIDLIEPRIDLVEAITSDPLTQFAVISSALIYDVEHPGVPNAQLVKETSNLACKYNNNKSVAEPNSVDTACNLLMKPVV
jgi:hypothetical protein